MALGPGQGVPTLSWGMEELTKQGEGPHGAGGQAREGNAGTKSGVRASPETDPSLKKLKTGKGDQIS